MREDRRPEIARQVAETLTSSMQDGSRLAWKRHVGRPETRHQEYHSSGALVRAAVSTQEEKLTLDTAHARVVLIRTATARDTTTFWPDYSPIEESTRESSLAVEVWAKRAGARTHLVSAFDGAGKRASDATWLSGLFGLALSQCQLNERGRELNEARSRRVAERAAIAELSSL